MRLSLAHDCTTDPYSQGLPHRSHYLGCFSATSAHTGGVMGVFMDGHARFLGDGINLMTWRALGTRAGNEIVEVP